jgi:malto-oligosyltrehalose trehalohydrolase
VLYELHVGTFTPGGTYAAAIERLDDLAALGITAVELMPLAQPAGVRNWGYDGVLPFAPQHAYGTPDELKAFVDAAHARGLCVFLDVVYNHFGPEGNYLQAFAKPIFTERHHTPWGAAINVDGDDADIVRALFVHNALYWLREYRFDGLRFDAVHEIPDDSKRPFLDELAARVHAGVEDGRHVQLVLENDANQSALLARFDAQWNDDAHHAFQVLLTGETFGYYRDYGREPARLLARALCEGFAYQGEPSAHRDGAPRGEPSAALPTTAFVDFLQNHDQIGNRAFGERIDALAPEAAIRAGAAVLLLAPAIPLLFMGEEWSASTPFLFFSDFGGELAHAVTEGRRREFAGWPGFSEPADTESVPDPQEPDTMRASVLRWDERAQPVHAAMLAFHRELLALRASVLVPRLRDGAHGRDYDVVAPTAVHVTWRLGDGSRLELVANLGPEPVSAVYATAGTPIFTLGDVPACSGEGMLGAWSVGWFLDA